MYEYEDYTNGQYGWAPFTVRKINWSGNYIESIEVAKEWTGQSPQQQPKTTYYSWLDHQLRFSVNPARRIWLICLAPRTARKVCLFSWNILMGESC